MSAESCGGPDEGRLARLERGGVIRRARRARLDEIAAEREGFVIAGVRATRARTS